MYTTRQFPVSGPEPGLQPATEMSIQKGMQVLQGRYPPPHDMLLFKCLWTQGWIHPHMGGSRRARQDCLRSRAAMEGARCSLPAKPICLRSPATAFSASDQPPWLLWNRNVPTPHLYHEPPSKGVMLMIMFTLTYRILCNLSIQLSEHVQPNAMAYTRATRGST